MRTPTRSPTGGRLRGRSRFGYDHQWWGEAPRPDGPRSYWTETLRPLPSLIFILPILLAYELAVDRLGGPAAEVVRTGADAWMRQGLAGLGLTDPMLPPLGLVIGLLAWQGAERRDWRFDPGCLIGMAVESLVLAIVLIGLCRLVDLGFARLDGEVVLQATMPGERRGWALLVGFLGAGLYEETLFRLTLVPGIYGILRLLQAPTIVAGTIAVTGSSLLFSMAHHAGSPGEAFTWFAFIFRWLAGVFFAWVFVVRGFGVAVGTHTAYDILVGWLGWHF